MQIEYIIMLLWMLVLGRLKQQNIFHQGQLGENKDKKTSMFFIYFLPIVILIMFRGESVGADTGNYLFILENGRYQSWTEIFSHKDFGYYTFNKLLSSLEIHPQWLFIITGLFVSIIHSTFFTKNSTNMFLVTLGYLTFGLFSFDLTGVRQSIAMAICLLSIPYIFSKDLVKFFFIIAIAYTFHASAIFFIIAYFVGIKKDSRWDIAFFSLGGLFVGLSYCFFSSRIFSHIADYSNYSQVESTGNGHVFFAILLVILFFIESNKKIIIQDEPRMKVFINLNYIAFSLWIVRLFTRTSERVFLYFVPFTIICYAIIPKYLKKNEARLVTCLMVILILILFAKRLNDEYVFF